MMEFILSKLSLVTVGIVLVAAVSGMFGSLDDRTEWHSAKGCIDRISHIINAIVSTDDATGCRIVMSEYLPSRESTLEITNGSIWLIWGDVKCAAEISADMDLIDDSMDNPVETDTLSCSYDDVVIISHVPDEMTTASIHIEKVSTSEATAFTNLSHSAIVL